MFRLLRKYTKDGWWATLLGPIFTVAEVVVDALIPLVMSDIIDKGIYGMGGNMEYIWGRGVHMVLLAVLGAVFGALSGLFSSIASTRFIRNIRSAMFAKVQEYSFENIECNQHVQRDCQRCSDETQHKWPVKMKKLIGRSIKDRKIAKDRGETSFDDKYRKKFHDKVQECISEGWGENAPDKERYGADFERSLLKRIEAYYENYFAWQKDFRLPTTNNLSERSLRSIKSHMKISGQFESVAAADDYALIKSYIETCRRNSINEIDALQRLCDGDPYTVNEIFSHSP